MRAWLVLLLAGCSAARPERILDTHIHLYDPRRPEGVPWPAKGDAVLYRPVLPAEFHALAREHGVAAAVVVEASPWLEDNRWILDLTRGDAFFPGVVGNLKPGAPDFSSALARFAADPRFVGIRARPGLDDRSIADLRLLAARGKSLDLLRPPPGLAAEIARRVPELTIVLDHLADAKVAAGPPARAWLDDVRAAAAFPNVYVKLSGLDQQAGKAADLELFRPTLDALWSSFGEERLMYGSNWPVTLLHTDYRTHLDWVIDYVRPKGREAMDKVFWRNAVKAYRLRL